MDDYLEILNLMGKQDISKEPFDDIIGLCWRYSTGSSKNKVRAQESSAKIVKSTNDEVIGAKIGNLFENFKIDFIRSLSSQLIVFLGKVEAG